MAQTSAYRPTPKNPTTYPDQQPSGAELVEEIDDLLAEVDQVLEDNVLEVLRTFVNRGGE